MKRIFTIGLTLSLFVGAAQAGIFTRMNVESKSCRIFLESVNFRHRDELDIEWMPSQRAKLVTKGFDPISYFNNSYLRDKAEVGDLVLRALSVDCKNRKHWVDRCTVEFQLNEVTREAADWDANQYQEKELKTKKLRSWAFSGTSVAEVMDKLVRKRSFRCRKYQ